MGSRKLNKLHPRFKGFKGDGQPITDDASDTNKKKKLTCITVVSHPMSKDIQAQIDAAFDEVAEEREAEDQ